MYCSSEDVIYVKNPTPSLGLLAKAYSRGTAISLIVALLGNLVLFTNVKEKLSGEQFDELGRLILDQFGDCSVSEIMRFFYEFKVGKYGEFYGAVDPLKIMADFSKYHRQCIAWRGHYQSLKERATRDAEWEEARKSNAKLSSDYQRRVPFANTPKQVMSYFEYVGSPQKYYEMDDERFAEVITQISKSKEEREAGVKALLEAEVQIISTEALQKKSENIQKKNYETE